MVIKGQNLRLFLNNRILAMATTCSVDLRNTFQEDSTKDDENLWIRQMLVSQDWSMSCECVVATDIDYGMTVDEVKDYVGETLQVNFALADGEHNADQGDVLITGNAILSGFTINAQNRQRGTCQLQLTGVGRIALPILLADSDGVLLADSDGVIMATLD